MSDFQFFLILLQAASLATLAVVAVLALVRWNRRP